MPNIRFLLLALTTLWLTACAELPFQFPFTPALHSGTGTADSSPQTAPIPRLETGGHTAPIIRIAVDRAGRWLVTAADDKTARVWDLQTGELVQVLRPPIGGDAREGKLYAVAISPDGATVAVGGFTAAAGRPPSIYLFDRATGTLRRALGGLPEVVNHLAWSPDGRRLAATLGGANGLRVYEPAELRELYADRDYGDQSYGADFATDGRLLTTSWDGLLRLYQPAGDGYQRAEPVRAPGGKRPFLARFAPDGRRIAVGYDDTTRVDVLDATTLALLPGYAATDGIDNGDLGIVAWSRDGRTLYAAGRYDDGSGRSPVLRWADGGRGPRTAVALATNTVMDLAALADGGLAFGAGDPLWGVLGADGQVRRYGGGQIADFRGRETELRVDATGTRIELGYRTAAADLAWQTHTACFELAARRLTAGTCPGSSLRAADTGGQPLADWLGTTTPRFDGRALTLLPYEVARSLAVSRRGFVLGAEWSIYAFERDGTQRWRQPLPGTAWAVNVSSDGRYVVVAVGDGTLRWYADHKDRAEEVLALYVHPDGKRWIAWTPQGFFDASGPDAEELFGFHVNRGREQAGEFVRASQLRERFLNPELIAHRLDADGDERLARAVGQRGAISVALQNAERLQLTRRSPASVQSADGDVRLEFALDRPLRPGEKLVMRVDGKEIDARDADASTGKQFIPLTLTLAPGPHRVETAARNTQQVDSEWIETRVEVAPRELQRGLHVIAVGVSRYYDSAFDLRFAASDANAFADALAARARAPAFPRGLVTRKVLIDSQARRDDILRAFADLAASPALQPEDTVVVFLAGHGLSRDGDYRFIPHELQVTDTAAVARQALDGDTLRSLLRRLPADTLIVLDTCDAGDALPGARGDNAIAAKEQLARTIELSGRTFLAATGPKNLAMEGYREHGFFTYALLEGIEKPELYENGRLTVDRLWAYAYDRIGELTAAHGFRQVPMRDAQNRTFPIAGPLR